MEGAARCLSKHEPGSGIFPVVVWKPSVEEKGGYFTVIVNEVGAVRTTADPAPSVNSCFTALQ